MNEDDAVKLNLIERQESCSKILYLKRTGIDYALSVQSAQHQVFETPSAVVWNFLTPQNWPKFLGSGLSRLTFRIALHRSFFYHLDITIPLEESPDYRLEIVQGLAPTVPASYLVCHAVHVYYRAIAATIEACDALFVHRQCGSSARRSRWGGFG